MSGIDRGALLELARTYGVFHVRVFGSVARGEAGADSDIDLLVEIAPDRSFFDLVGFWQDAQDLLGRRVDVVTLDGLSPYLRDRITAEAVAL